MALMAIELWHHVLDVAGLVTCRAIVLRKMKMRVLSLREYPYLTIEVCNV